MNSAALSGWTPEQPRARTTQPALDPYTPGPALDAGSLHEGT